MQHSENHNCTNQPPTYNQATTVRLLYMPCVLPMADMRLMLM